MELSDFYTNKGTSKYGRIYMEVEQRKQKWGIMQLFGYEQVAKRIANIRLTMTPFAAAFTGLEK